MFAEGTADNTCVISSELASYNDLAVGDTITLSNPNQEDETYTLTIAGIYETESTSDSASSMMVDLWQEQTAPIRFMSAIRH